jgi:hypothetical protein
MNAPEQERQAGQFVDQPLGQARLEAGVERLGCKEKRAVRLLGAAKALPETISAPQPVPEWAATE